MPLKLAASNDSPPATAGQGPRILAPGAPPSPGPIPTDLARHLVHGEALVWWSEKDRIHLGPIALVVAAAVSILGFVSLLAPEFWLQPWSELWKPIAALLSPSAVMLVRERINQRAVLVTDVGIVDVSGAGEVQRLSFEGIKSVRRDLLRGGMILEGQRARVRIPPSLADSTHKAIASQRRNRVGGPIMVDDPTGWLP